MGHIGILVVAVRRLSRTWKVKTLLAGPSPTSPMKAEITISPISNRWKDTVCGRWFVENTELGLVDWLEASWFSLN